MEKWKKRRKLEVKMNDASGLGEEINRSACPSAGKTSFIQEPSLLSSFFPFCFLSTLSPLLYLILHNLRVTNYRANDLHPFSLLAS